MTVNPGAERFRGIERPDGMSRIDMNEMLACRQRESKQTSQVGGVHAW
jgi:hypothetical protein